MSGAPGSGGIAAVGARDHFQVVTIGVGKVDPAPAIVMIDLTGAAALRIGPIVETPVADAAEDSVKIRLANQEGVVLWSDRAVGIGEVERDAIVEFHHVEMAEADRRRSPQHLGQEQSGLRLVR
jgi:hypothetical protein